MKTEAHFDPDLIEANADAAIAAVVKAGERGADLVQAWVAAKNAAAVAEVAERGAGTARKAARRGLNVLKSRGVVIPERRRVATLPKKEEPIVEGWMLAPDATGTELFVISTRTETSRARAVLVFLHATRGVARIVHRTLSQSQLKEHLASISPNSGSPIVKVPASWIRFRIAQARKVHAANRLPEPMGFASARSLLEPVPQAAPPHPFDEEGFELADEDADDIAKQSIGFHALPEFRGWFPPKAAIDELVAKVGQRLKPGEQPDPDLIKQLFVEEIDAATDRYFVPQVREELVDLMKDSALSVLARDGEQRALEVAAVIQSISKRGLVTDPPHELPFLRGFFEKALQFAAMQTGGKLSIPVPEAPLARAAAESATDDAEAASQASSIETESPEPERPDE